MSPRGRGDREKTRETKYQHKTLATITEGVQRIAVILPVEEQEGEEGGRSQLQEKPKEEEGSQGQEEQSRQGRMTQSNDEPVQERSSPERGEVTQRRKQPRRNCRNSEHGSHKRLYNCLSITHRARQSHTHMHPSRTLFPK